MMCFTGYQYVSGYYIIMVTVTAFDCVRGTGPAYFQRVCLPVVDVTGRSHLRSVECRDMLVPWIRTEFGRRTFHIAAPVIWNSLPARLRSASIITRRQFRDGLKVHFFLKPTHDPLRTLVLRVYLLTHKITFSHCRYYHAGVNKQPQHCY